MNKKVKVYSTPTCPFCIMAKKFLKDNNIEFEDIDVSRNIKAAREMVEKTGQMGVPVIEIDGEFVIGFDRNRIKELLQLQ
jgi:glutaredoxin-like YruB-family protein